MSSCLVAFALDLRTASLNPLTQQRAIVILNTLSHDSFAKLAASNMCGSQPCAIPFIPSRALDKMRAAPRGALHPASVLVPKTACTSVSMLKLLPYPWAGARKLHSEGADYDKLLTDAVQIGL